jgi:hypothetical protein
VAEEEEEEMEERKERGPRPSIQGLKTREGGRAWDLLRRHLLCSRRQTGSSIILGFLTYTYFFCYVIIYIYIFQKRCNSSI